MSKTGPQAGGKRLASTRRNGVYWGGYAEQAGIVRISCQFLGYMTDLSITREEALWAIVALSYQFDSATLPFPSHDTIARQLGYSRKQSERHAKSLVKKGYLVKQDNGRKSDGTYRSMGLDFSLLLEAVDRLARQDLLSRDPRRWSRSRRDEEMKSAALVDAEAARLNQQYRKADIDDVDLPAGGCDIAELAALDPEVAAGLAVGWD